MQKKIDLLQIQKNINKLQRELSNFHGTIVAVAKQKPILFYQSIVEAGVNHIGENRAQEVRDKMKEGLFNKLQKDIFLHFIAPIQKNKIKYLGKISSFDAIISQQMAEQIHDFLKKENKQARGLIQINVTEEKQKEGIKNLDQLMQLFESFESENLDLSGIMVMGPTPQNESIQNHRRRTEKAFKIARKWFEELERYNSKAHCLSMGMSSDYQIAIECGSNEIRLGSALLGGH